MSESGLCVADIPEDGSKGFDYKSEKLFAVKKKGKIFVYKNSCPHIGVALDWEKDKFLDSSKSMIQCANHGALFVIENGGHLFLLSHVEESVATILEFLDRPELEQRKAA